MVGARRLFVLLACCLLETGDGLSPLEVAPDVCTVKIDSSGHKLLARHFSPRLPEASAKAPAVLLLHGIPGTEQNWDVAYALRDAGFHCLLFHYQGCWGSEGNYSVAGLPGDIDCAFKWLVQQPNVDAQKLVVTGHSLGGYHALRMATESCRLAKVPAPFEQLPGTPLRLRGVAALCPLVGCDSIGRRLPDEYARDFAQYLTNISPAAILDQLSELEAIKELARSLPAPADRRDKLPLLVITGDADPLFGVDYYQENLWGDLRECAAVDAQYVRLQHGDHALCRYRRRVVQHVVRFARQCVGPPCHAPRWQDRVRGVVQGLEKWVDAVPLMVVAAAVGGFAAGRYEATPEGREQARREEVAGRRRETTLLDVE